MSYKRALLVIDLYVFSMAGKKIIKKNKKKRRLGVYDQLRIQSEPK